MREHVGQVLESDKFWSRKDSRPLTLVRSAACVEGFKKSREEVDRASSRKTDPIGTDEAASDSQLRRGGVSGSSQSLPRGSLFLTAGR